MKLIIRLRKDASPMNTAFLMCAVLLDLMAYVSYVISKQFHNSETMIDFQRKTVAYSESDFRVNMFIADTSFPRARHVVGPQNTRTLTVLGWTNDTRILNATLYPDHVQKNTPQFMTTLFNIGCIWLGAATILPPRHIHDLDDTNIQDQDNFSTV